MRRLPIMMIAIAALGAASAVAAYQAAWQQGSAGEAHWQEIAWPYPRDGWPAGRAFRCQTCGGGIELYVRPKLGFCNCDTGVADDDEVDRIADLDLISARFAPRARGEVIHIAELSGRSRAYDLDIADGARHAAVGIAVSHRCDLLVAVAQGEGPLDEVQRAALAFLSSDEMKRWMTAVLGG
jgi:hypothetical protein